MSSLFLDGPAASTRDKIYLLFQPPLLPFFHLPISSSCNLSSLSSRSTSLLFLQLVSLLFAGCCRLLVCADCSEKNKTKQNQGWTCIEVIPLLLNQINFLRRCHEKLELNWSHCSRCWFPLFFQPNYDLVVTKWESTVDGAQSEAWTSAARVALNYDSWPLWDVGKIYSALISTISTAGHTRRHDVLVCERVCVWVCKREVHDPLVPLV